MRSVLGLLALAWLLPAAAHAQQLADLYGNGRKVRIDLTDDTHEILITREGQLVYQIAADVGATKPGRLEYEVRRVPQLPGEVLVVYETFHLSPDSPATMTSAGLFSGVTPCMIGPISKVEPQKNKTTLQIQVQAALTTIKGLPQRTTRADAIVLAKGDWQQIGDLAACVGEEIEILAEGKWTIRKGYYDEATADGYLRSPLDRDYRVNKDGLFGSLLCRTGGVGDGAVVGALGSFTAQDTGPVECRINDSAKWDNAGKVEVKVKLSTPGGVLVSPKK